MIEITGHPAYAAIDDCRERGVVVDYVVLDGQGAGGGKEAHREAAIAGMAVLADRRERWAVREHALNPNVKVEPFLYAWRADSLDGNPYPASSLFAPPDDPPAFDMKATLGAYLIEWDKWHSEVLYAHAFLKPPYPCRDVGVEDWKRVNALLFSSLDAVEVYSWNTDWSDYFDEGLEWWGAYYWTVYDPPRDAFVVIGASASD